MAATLQHPENPKLKHIVYSRYRDLLGSYNNKANAIIEKLPENHGINFGTIDNNKNLNILQTTTTDINGCAANGQRQQSSNYEAPACVQNAMMTKDKKPFTYTPGGIDLSQIKSERMAKRLQRNAQADGITATQQQQPRPSQPRSPGASAATAIGAAALGMPFQVLPPPPPPPQPGMPGKQSTLNSSTPAPPPPPPTSSFSNKTKTLAPPTNDSGLGSAPGSPNAARKSPAPQRFEPPPLGFRPEIKIPPNPMANLRKVPPPVEKNTFWKDEYVKERSKSPMVGDNDRDTSPVGIARQNNNYNYNNSNNVNDDIAPRKIAPTTVQPIQEQQPDSYSYNNQNNPYKQQSMVQPRTEQAQQQYNAPAVAPEPSTSPYSKQQNSPRSEFRSIPVPQPPAVNTYTRQTDSPRSAVDGKSISQENNGERSTESPLKFGQQTPPQQHPYMHRPPAVTSPLAQQLPQQSQHMTSPLTTTNNTHAQTVPWRTQRSQPHQQEQQRQPSPQPLYNNVNPTQQQAQPIHKNTQNLARSPDPNTNTYLQQKQEQIIDKPTSVGSLYIAPLEEPTEPQAQQLVHQQLQQKQRNSPMRQLGSQSVAPQQLRWLSSQNTPKDQPSWARPEQKGNLMPSSSPPTMQQQKPQQPQQQQIYASQNRNGYVATNFGAQPNAGATGLRLQINDNIKNTTSSNGPKEHIIPIHLEQTPTNISNPNYGQGNTNVAGYIMRSPNQFVDQGYNSLSQQQQCGVGVQRVMSPTQKLNSQHIMQQQEHQLQATNNVKSGNKTRIIPISFEGSNSNTSSSPILFQKCNYNLIIHDCPLEAEIRYRKHRLSDSRTPPIQSKSFRILQKITDTIDDGSSDEQISKKYKQNINNVINDKGAAQLQRPQYAREMSVEDAKNSLPIDQLRHIQIGQEKGNNAAQQSRFLQRPSNEQPQQYIPPNELQTPEPKKYTGSAIPSKSFKLLQAMTTPENAEQNSLTTEVENSENNELNETNLKNNVCNDNNNNNNQQQNDNIIIINTQTKTNQPNVFTETLAPFHTNTCVNTNASENTNIKQNSENEKTQLLAQQLPQNMQQYPTYIYPYAPIAWFPPPPLPAGVEPAANWPYAYAIPTHPPHQTMPNCSSPVQTFSYPPYPFYYTSFFTPPSHCNKNTSTTTPNDVQSIIDSEHSRNVAQPFSYAYPVAPSYSQDSTSSRSSSVVPDIIITPSNDENPSKIILQHHIRVEKRDPSPMCNNSLEIEEVCTKPPLSNIMLREGRDGSIIDALSQRLKDINKLSESHGNLSKNMRKQFEGENAHIFEEQIFHTSDEESSSESLPTSDNESEITPKEAPKVNQLQAIKSVTNVQFYRDQDIQVESDDTDDDEDDVTTADGKSDIFDEETEEYNNDIEEEIILEFENNDYSEIEDLSVIYEEESEFERNAEIKSDEGIIKDLQTSATKENDLVTVRLPLKFTYSTEIGGDETQEMSIQADKRNTFSIAKIDSTEEAQTNDDECDVSVTISLTPSSRSRSCSVENKAETSSLSTAYPPFEELPIPEEDVAVVFSLNLCNKLKNETIQGHVTDNISELQNEQIEQKVIKNECDTKNVEPEAKNSDANKIKKTTSTEFDFFATLKATKLQAQQILESSNSYWGTATKGNKAAVENSTTIDIAKAAEKIKIESTDNAEKNKRPLSIDKTTLAKVKNDFWATVAGADKSSVMIPGSHEEKNSLWMKDEKEEKKDSSEELPVKTSFLPSLQNLTNSTVSSSQFQETKRETTSTVYKGEKVDMKKTNKLEVNKMMVPQPEKVEEQKKNYVVDEKKTADESKVERNSKLATKKSEKNLTDTDTTVKSKKKKTVGSLKKKKKTIQTTDINVQIQTDNVNVKEETSNNSLTKSYSESIMVKENIKANTTETITLQQHEDEEGIDFWAEIEKSRSTSHDMDDKTKITYSDKNNDIDNQPIIPHDTISEISAHTDGCTVSRRFKRNETGRYEESNIYGNITQNHMDKYEITTQQIETKDADIKNLEPGSSHAVITARHEEYHDEAEDTDFWAEIIQNEKTDETPTVKYDPTKYPEEPREVDTDEEIDFWAEIEEKRRDYDPDVTFQSAATFWAKRDRQNSVEETPYKPVEIKAFHAKLPDETSVDINIWAALEAAKGEEPEFIDPAIEEEKLLMTINEGKGQKLFSGAESLDEPVLGKVCQLQGNRSCEENNSEEPDFWAEIENERETLNAKAEAEVKRNNYRKAMAFFTTSIDEQKGHKTDKTIALELIPEQVIEEAEPSNLGRNEAQRSNTSTPTNAVGIQVQKARTTEINVQPIDDKEILLDEIIDFGINNMKEKKSNIKERISVFENTQINSMDKRKATIKKSQSLSVESHTTTLSRNSSAQLSEEDDSGVTDMNKHLSETDTESESFPELRKMSSYQRAATHSRLFKLLQDETDLSGTDQTFDEYQFKPSRRKIVHNVSITRKRNPDALNQAETMTQRRERLSLPLRKNTSIDADNPSTPNSPVSPTMGQINLQRTPVTDKLVNELIQSLLLKSDSTHLRKLPMEKLQAAAKRALKEELNSVENTSVDSTSDKTSNSSRYELTDKSYADYYDTWSEKSGSSVQSKAFHSIQDASRRSPLTVRCPRVLNSKTNRDLARVTESPEIHSRSSNSPECFRQSRERSLSIWRK